MGKTRSGQSETNVRGGCTGVHCDRREGAVRTAFCVGGTERTVCQWWVCSDTSVRGWGAVTIVCHMRRCRHLSVREGGVVTTAATRRCDGKSS